MNRTILISGACLGLVLGACSNGSSSSSSATSAPAALPSDSAASNVAASPSAAPTVAPSPTVSVAYSDLGGVFGAGQIVQLGQLGVFETTSGLFKPNDPITRRTFVRWLYKANNAIWGDDDSKQIRPATAADPSVFKDVASSDPDFQYIQGLQDAGTSVGFPDKTFRPDQVLTREQMVAIKSVLDKGGIQDTKAADIPQERYELPNWKDKSAIAPEFVAAICSLTFNDSQHIDDIGRVFGTISSFRPKAPVTRAQAAVLMWKIGDHAMYSVGVQSTRTAAQALIPSAAPSP